MKILCGVPVREEDRRGIPYDPPNIAEYVVRPCATCKMPIYVGPKMEKLSTKLRLPIFCPFCVAKMGAGGKIEKLA